MNDHDEDPFEEIARGIRRKDQEKAATERISEARARMVSFKVEGVSKPATVFYTSLLLRMEPACDWSLETMETDGEQLRYNPEYVMGLPLPELFGVLAHETLHPALGHHARRGDRDPSTWNLACDAVVNPQLIQAGFKLPPGVAMPGRGQLACVKANHELSAEQVYDLLQEEQPDPDEKPQGGDQGAGSGDGQEQGQPESGEGQSDAEGQGEGQAQEGPRDPGGCGSVTEPQDGSPAAAKEAEAKWQVAVAQAADMARKIGTLPGGMDRLIGEVLHPQADWKQILREFVSRFARSERSWASPNRRFIQYGMVLPSLRSEELGDVVVAVDTSGSIRQKELEVFAGELQGILEVYECSLTVLYHDAEVLKVEHWQPTDGPLKLSPVGGGGTSHVPVFDWLTANDHGDAVCMICFTDLATEFPDTEPLTPTLWAAVGDYHKSVKIPFGRLVPVEVL